jgi:hypothetical protein
MVYRLSHQLPPDFGWFSPESADFSWFSARIDRFWTSRTGFSSSLGQSKWGTENTLCCGVGETKYIYMSGGPSGPIFMFLIQFDFYPTKRSRFEKISPPMLLEFHLVFLHIFPDFLFFEIFEFQFKKSAIFKTGPGRSR